MSWMRPLDKAVTDDPEPTQSEESDDPPWWDGRQVAIRPDVPGRALDPGDLVLIRTDEEWVEIEPRIDDYATKVKETPVDKLWPEWMSEE